MTQRQHVALRLTGRNRPHNLQRLRVDNRDRAVKLRGHVEQPVLRSKQRHMRPYPEAEVHMPHHLLRGNIDDHQVAAIRSLQSHARVPIDGHICQLSIRRRHHLMPRRPALWNRRNHRSRPRIDNRQAILALLRHQQPRLLRMNRRDDKRNHQKQTSKTNRAHKTLLNYRINIPAGLIDPANKYSERPSVELNVGTPSLRLFL